jgi:hypothetical protein
MSCRRRRIKNTGRIKGETIVCSERRETGGGKRGLMARQNERVDLKEERTKGETLDERESEMFGVSDGREGRDCLEDSPW